MDRPVVIVLIAMNNPSIPPPLSSQGLKVRFSLNRWDLIQCRLWVVSHNRFLVLFSVAVSLGVPLMNLRDSSIRSRSVGFKIFYVVVLASVMLVFMSVLQVAFQFVWMMLNKNRGVLGEHEIGIRNEGLEDGRERIYTSLVWLSQDQMHA